VPAACVALEATCLPVTRSVVWPSGSNETGTHGLSDVSRDVSLSLRLAGRRDGRGMRGSMESSCEKRDSAHPQKIPVGSRSISSSILAISVVGAVYL